MPTWPLFLCFVCRLIVLGIVAVIAGVGVSYGQDCGATVHAEYDVDFPPREEPVEKEPRYRALREALQQEYFSVGLLVQTLAEVRPDEASATGFGVANARIKLSGLLDEGFAYKLQADLASGFTLKDARLSYCLGRQVTLDAGQFKPPFSLENLTSTARTHFVRRARVVEALVPGRRVGAAVMARTAAGAVLLRGAVFNGRDSTTAAGAAVGGGSPFLYVGRVGFQPPGLGGALVLGANLAYEAVVEQTIAGADARAAMGHWLLGVELIGTRGRTTRDGGASPWGYYATLGYSLTPEHQVLLRLDHFEAGTDSSVASDVVVLGYTFQPTHTARIEANYELPLQESSQPSGRLLVNFQIAF